MIEKNKNYRIKGKSKYFKDKYGTSNPIIRIEGEADKLFDGPWENKHGNPACLLFHQRWMLEGLPNDTAYYGHILQNTEFGEISLGELVSESELEEV